MVLAACLAAGPACAVEDLVFERREDWEAWSFPPGTLDIAPDGRVQVARVRKEINPVLNAHTFTYESSTGGPATGGIRSVGSNPAAAFRIMDGDRTSAWAPDPDDPVEEWWIEVDLGRSVPATELRLIFAADGPPFSDFRVFVSTGELRFPGTQIKALSYVPVIQTRGPNEEHEFVHLFEVRDALGRPLTGQLLQYIKIFIDRPVEGAALAELEITALGDNIAQGTLSRGGNAVSGQIAIPVNIFDGLLWSSWKMTNLGTDWLQGVHLLNGPWIRWDLGAEFWVDTMKITSSGGAASYNNPAGPPMDGFRVFFSGGKEGTLTRHEVWQVEGRNIEWDLIADLNNTLNAPDFLENFEFHFDPSKKVRYIFFHHFYGASVWQTGYSLGSNMYEFQLFGEGFLPGSTLLSPLLETGDAYVTGVEWEGETPPGTRLEIETRTGNTVEELTFYYDKNGNLKSEDEYNALPRSFKGPIVTERLPIEEEWSTWSAPYNRPGDRFVSPSPSKFLLVRARLSSDSPQTAPALDRLVFRLADPVVQRISGRIEPATARPGVLNEFTYLLQPEFRFGNSGFDRILIETPSRVRDVQVRVGGAEVIPERIEITPDSLVIDLPSTVTRQTTQVGFATLLKSDNTVFDAAVASGSGAWQRVDPETASALIVRMPLFAESRRLIHELRAEPQVVTPNGDGINDGAAVRFAVLKVDAARRIQVALYDLGGRPVRLLYDEMGTSALYGGDGEIVWNGRDEAGNLVPPGAYVCRVEVRGDATEEARQVLVSVAY